MIIDNNLLVFIDAANLKAEVFKISGKPKSQSKEEQDLPKQAIQSALPQTSSNQFGISRMKSTSPQPNQSSFDLLANNSSKNVHNLKEKKHMMISNRPTRFVSQNPFNERQDYNAQQLTNKTGEYQSISPPRTSSQVQSPKSNLSIEQPQQMLASDIADQEPIQQSLPNFTQVSQRDMRQEEVLNQNQTFYDPTKLQQLLSSYQDTMKKNEQQNLDLKSLNSLNNMVAIDNKKTPLGFSQPQTNKSGDRTPTVDLRTSFPIDDNLYTWGISKIDKHYPQKESIGVQTSIINPIDEKRFVPPRKLEASWPKMDIFLEEKNREIKNSKRFIQTGSNFNTSSNQTFTTAEQVQQSRMQDPANRVRSELDNNNIISKRVQSPSPPNKAIYDSIQINDRQINQITREGLYFMDIESNQQEQVRQNQNQERQQNLSERSNMLKNSNVQAEQLLKQTPNQNYFNSSYRLQQFTNIVDTKQTIYEQTPSSRKYQDRNTKQRLEQKIQPKISTNGFGQALGQNFQKDVDRSQGYRLSNRSEDRSPDKEYNPNIKAKVAQNAQWQTNTGTRSQKNLQQSQADYNHSGTQQERLLQSQLQLLNTNSEINNNQGNKQSQLSLQRVEGTVIIGITASGQQGIIQGQGGIDQGERGILLGSKPIANGLTASQEIPRIGQRLGVKNQESMNQECLEIDQGKEGIVQRSRFDQQNNNFILRGGLSKNSPTKQFKNSNRVSLGEQEKQDNLGSPYYQNDVETKKVEIDDFQQKNTNNQSNQSCQQQKDVYEVNKIEVNQEQFYFFGEPKKYSSSMRYKYQRGTIQDNELDNQMQRILGPQRATDTIKMAERIKEAELHKTQIRRIYNHNQISDTAITNRSLSYRANNVNSPSPIQIIMPTISVDPNQNSYQLLVVPSDQKQNLSLLQTPQNQQRNMFDFTQISPITHSPPRNIIYRT